MASRIVCERVVDGSGQEVQVDDLRLGPLDQCRAASAVEIVVTAVADQGVAHAVAHDRIGVGGPQYLRDGRRVRDRKGQQPRADGLRAGVLEIKIDAGGELREVERVARIVRVIDRDVALHVLAEDVGVVPRAADQGIGPRPA